MCGQFCNDGPSSLIDRRGTTNADTRNLNVCRYDDDERANDRRISSAR
jgi:hypothetical protein